MTAKTNLAAFGNLLIETMIWISLWNIIEKVIIKIGGDNIIVYIIILLLFAALYIFVS